MFVHSVESIPAGEFELMKLRTSKPYGGGPGNSNGLSISSSFRQTLNLDKISVCTGRYHPDGKMPVGQGFLFYFIDWQREWVQRRRIDPVWLRASSH
jgi:hypothetical protein